ncbi:MAG: cupin domain-containing protein [Desulfobacteraceae bacterium]|nr:cupin domain-containing protein [Desulfobacteraceae bacterium]
MRFEAINFNEKFLKFDEQWSPKIIGQMNDYQFKLVKIQGHFTWHEHKDTDEVFIVLEGEMSIDFKDGRVNISENEMFIVPKGAEHKPYAENECKILLIEPKGVINTGDSNSELTAEEDVWI